MLHDQYGRLSSRVVSDHSRFEHVPPRLRSRNTTPTSLDDDRLSIITFDTVGPGFQPSTLKKPVVTAGRPRTLIEIAEANRSLPKIRERGPTPPEKDEHIKRLNPSYHDLHDNDLIYPESIIDPYTTPHIPKLPTHDELPAEMETKEYLKIIEDDAETLTTTAGLQSLNSKQKRLEEDLVKTVMNRPLFAIPASKFVGHDRFQDKSLTITANFVLYVFEIMLGITCVTLSGVLLNQDTAVGVGIYRYFIADSVVSTAVAILFITRVINFEKRNGSFYCLAAALMKIVSFVMVTSHIIPMDCTKRNICDMRKAVSAFMIVSTFLWEGNLVMFLTTLYISRLNLLDDINFDFSEKGLSHEYNTKQGHVPLAPHLNPLTGEPLKEYYLNEHGEMYQLDETMDVRGKNKIIVYTF
ncbi:uncharacterized protein CANTADRAFT_25418 [Suhomyces tanzawaensis NRRL Y-17324]|uniref:Uncharacterized protein n=1 Tax=Suhomyces tanzawaensis NRRL Y-17324 TaxID=984487 RepID=A0A1E4SNX6_9ASCO|nr:uncharacterized protein CANTADRAFT_25418 [Suhomyces tanzawaensis NRRL Y-17324]ODV81196.1 hypothetical protein CANTADRAFT_25418 [Suhomyces tanzawaensis NRRL Y-17324]